VNGLRMADTPYLLTLALQEKIVAYIIAGGFPQVAAEAAGLPREVFNQWLEQGEHPDAPPLYRAFARAVREAEAQTRLHAETKVHAAKPLDWLKTGPGKESADHPGWTNPGKPGGATETDASKRDSAARWSDIFHLFGRCAEQLAAYPDARAALAAWLHQQAASSEK
jgi:hypothetical protein